MKFISKYSNNKEVTPAQFITEMICEKKAKCNNEDLHYKFWMNKKWSAFFRNQIATANKLVKEFNPIAIVQALKDPKSKFLYSLRAPSLKNLIQQQQSILDSKNQELHQTLERKNSIEYKRPEGIKKNTLSKLKEIDNDG